MSTQCHDLGTPFAEESQIYGYGVSLKGVAILLLVASFGRVAALPKRHGQPTRELKRQGSHRGFTTGV